MHDFTITCFEKPLLSTSKKLLTKILNLLFQEIAMIQLILLYNKSQTTFISMCVFLEYEKPKSIVCKACHSHLLKIPPFYLYYVFLMHSNFRVILTVINIWCYSTSLMFNIHIWWIKTENITTEMHIVLETSRERHPPDVTLWRLKDVFGIFLQNVKLWNS